METSNEVFDLAEAAEHSQRIAHKIGHTKLAVEVFGWAIKHSKDIPTEALNELLVLVTGEPK